MRVRENSLTDRRAACFALGELPPAQLARHSAAFLKMLNDSDDDVRLMACIALSELPPAELAKHSGELVKRLNARENCAAVRRAACFALSKLPPAELARHSAELVKMLSDLVVKSTGWRKAQLPSFFGIHIDELLESHGNSWLHLAAAEGDANMCRALMRQHPTPKVLRNRAGKTASDVARSAGHSELADELQPQELEVRGGNGNAISEVLASKDFVSQVTWYIFPLPGRAGQVGAVHSMVQVLTLGGKRFLIESARPEEVHQRPDDEVRRGEIQDASKKGIYFSKWNEACDDALNLRKLSDKAPTLTSSESQVELGELARHLIRRGHYDAGCNNCHHVALAAYDYFARNSGQPENQLHSIPVNVWHTFLARAASWFGFDLSWSESKSFNIKLYEGIQRDEIVTGILPRNWESDGKEKPFLHMVQEGSDEFKALTQSLLLNASGEQIPGFAVSSIQRNENVEWLCRFRAELKEVFEQRHIPLLHASKAWEDIVVHGQRFRDAYVARVFNAYGCGHYFAQDLRLADWFAGEEPGQHATGAKERIVLLCRVAAGQSFEKERIFPYKADAVPRHLSGKTEDEWAAELRKPEHLMPPKLEDRKDSKYYDTCIAKETRDALIVYKEDKIYVEYVIKYTTDQLAGDPYDDRSLRGKLRKIPQ